LPELRACEPPARESLLHALAADLHPWVPGFRPLARDLLAEESRIDLFGVDERGAAVLVCLGEADPAVALVGRLLAQRRWLESRLSDWLKLAPGLGVRPDLPILGVLACPGFGPEARAAAEALDASWLRLVRYRAVRNGAGVGLLLEALEGAAASAPPDPPPTQPREPAPARFRTGLSDGDLELSDAERAEFE
jgi:hypothetical protein